MKTQTQKKNLPENFPHTLHERVRESSHELRKLLIGFSAAGVGLVFVVLTEKIEPELTLLQKWVLGAGLISFGVSLLAGLFAWRYDSEKNYYRAHELNSKKDSKKEHYKLKKNKYMKRGHNSVLVLTIFFGIGVLSLTIYALFRILAL